MSFNYGTSLGLLTDLYQLTMSQGYWKHGRSEREAVFHLYFRQNPFRGGYTIAAGLETALQFIEQFRFEECDINYLAGLTGNDGRQLFQPEFLSYMSTLKLNVDIDAVREGTVVFANEPLVRVQGPILQCQLLETALLNIINFQSLIATKAARVVGAAGNDPVLEFGLRRAQGIDGGLSASRAAFIGGCEATSNVLAGKVFGIPVKGTHAHSWVMSCDDELTSFIEYADAMPNNCVFLVDTFDTLDGVRHAITVGNQLRERGFEMLGIRLDSGDLAYLSIEARKMLDAAGFEDAAIVASNDLDERLIASLKNQGAAVSVWGVGTKLVTAFEQPALGGVYKLAALKDETGQWNLKLKLSEQHIKTSTPGKLQVRRFLNDGVAMGDMIYNEFESERVTNIIVDPSDSTRIQQFDESVESKELLVPVVKSGKVIYEAPALTDVQQRTQKQLSLFHSGIRRLENPHEYPVGLERGLYDTKHQMMIAHRAAMADN